MIIDLNTVSSVTEASHRGPESCAQTFDERSMHYLLR